MNCGINLVPTAMAAIASIITFKPIQTLELSAGSGVVKWGDRILLVADDEAKLHEMNILNKLSRTYEIPWEKLPEDFKEKKKKKPDFEALFLAGPVGAGEALIAWPSFSTPVRTKVALFTLPESGSDAELSAARVFDLSDLEPVLVKAVGKPNIEGAFYEDKHLVLFQRGSTGPSGYFKIPAPDLVAFLESPKKDLKLKFVPLELGKLSGVKLALTDATPVPGMPGVWIGLAAAEDTESTYDDGEVKGSVMVLIQGESIKTLGTLNPSKKFEGIAVEKSAKGLTVYLVDDADDPAKKSSLYQGEIPSSSFRF